MLAIISQSPAWSPLAQQQIEDDTTFLFDPAADTAAGLTAGFGGVIPVRSGTPPAIVAGKYRQGVQPSATPAGYVTIPCDGVLGAAEFTVEFWASCTADWSTITSQSLMLVGQLTSNRVFVRVNASSIQVVYEHNQNPASPTTYTQTLTYAIVGGQLPASTFESVAVTLLAGKLTLYVNAVQVGQLTGLVAPKVWGNTASSSDGVCIGGGEGSQNATSFIVSDVRISRRARSLTAGIVLPSSTTITVGVATGATIQTLAGGLHSVGTSPTGTTSADTQQTSLGGLKVMRTDKLLTVTPIKAGGTDASHPTAGQSGLYSYDWQVVDRTIDYIVALGCQPYISLDSTPQLLGGSVAPYSGVTLTTTRAGSSAYAAGPPNNNASFATMCADLVYHCLTEKGYTIPYWGLWNEPDGVSFWETGGTAVSDYTALYGAVMPAVKAVAPSIKVGGPEVSNWILTKTTWVKALIDYCGANAKPLDFISWHYYSGDLSEPAQIAAQVATWSTAAGIATPALINGEWCWTAANYGKWPWWQPILSGPDPGPDALTNYFLNDWHAGFAAASLIQMQANGVVRSILCDIGVTISGSPGGIYFKADGTVQSSYNVMRLWTLTQGNNVLSAVTTADPGVQCVASKNIGTGKVYVFLATLHYRKTQKYPVLVDLSGAGVSDGTAVTVYLVDDAHSNAYDAGTANASLQTGTTTIGTSGAGAVSGGKVGISLRPRSAALLVIG